MSASVLLPYFSRTRGTIKPGCHRLQKLFADTDHLFSSTPTILITGTNGKGSTCAIVESALRHCGFKTGLYTSPHLSHPNERIRINGIPIDEQHLAKAIETFESLSQRNLPDATFFEILTAVAIIIFAESACDVLIYEVGLGGRLDSTNVIAPCVSAITTVALEHTDYLGTTLSSIGWEKAHVARRNRPLVLGELNEEALKFVQAVMEKIGARIFVSHEAWPKVQGRFWLEQNEIHIQTARSILKAFEQETNFTLPPSDIERGIQNTFWPGRFDVRNVNKKTFIFDAAHNPAGVTYFKKQFFSSAHASAKNAILVFGVLADKDFAPMLEELSAFQIPIVFTEPSSERARRVRELTLVAENRCVNISAIETLGAALDYAQSQADLIIVLGSIALVGEAMDYLKIVPFETVNFQEGSSS